MWEPRYLQNRQEETEEEFSPWGLVLPTISLTVSIMALLHVLFH